MKKTLREDADYIIHQAIHAVQPDSAVKRALSDLKQVEGRTIVISFGKAAWQMAKAAKEVLSDRIDAGVIITKYDHSRGAIDPFCIFEAGHPVPDENSFLATGYAVNLVRNLTEKDLVILLISGGGSALFEMPLCSTEELQDITRQLLSCGADIREMNTVRKRLSVVKGGKFAQMCYPASVYAIVLSDILGDPLDMIASGPAYPDSTTVGMCHDIVEKYGLDLTDNVARLLEVETPKKCDNVRTVVNGSVKELCFAAERACKELGYETLMLTSSMSCVAREAGSFIGSIAEQYAENKKSVAFIAGGETVVHLTGSGLGGRNQELALAAAEKISGLKEVAVFSVGSDGTDGPTDVAGGFVDGDTRKKLEDLGYRIERVLEENDSYHALEKCDGLIRTGATGTNVNDVTVVLIKR